MTSTSRKPTVAFAHLGCEKNRVDTEHMLGLLTNAGYGVSADEDDAAVVVVNTCSFIQDAREESVRTLVNLAEQGKELIIAGCLAQHFQDELLESIPEAKAVGEAHTAELLEVASLSELPRQDPAANVEVDVSYSDLNFKDGLIVLGVVSLMDGDGQACEAALFSSDSISPCEAVA